jgi:F0F1-type ATP synthase membrane subunit b/b'
VVSVGIEDVSNTENQAADSQEGTSRRGTNREIRIMNTIVNTSILIMSVMMDAFAGLMVQATGTMAAEIVDAIGGGESGEEAKKEVEQKLPEVNEKMKTMIADIRKDVYTQFRQKESEIGTFLSDSAFDIGTKIVEKYDFNLPKLTESMDDKTLAQDTMLLVNGDPLFAEMLKELANWMDRTALDRC